MRYFYMLLNINHEKNYIKGALYDTFQYFCKMKKSKNNLIMQLCYGIDYDINSYPIILKPKYVSYYDLYIYQKSIYYYHIDLNYIK